MTIDDDVRNWNADMDAWGLTEAQRVHHLYRLHDYHRRIEALHWQRWERWDVFERWFAVAAGIAALVSVIVLLSGCAHPTPKPAPTPSPVDSASADATRDLGAGKPGAYCATNRVGKHFTKDGVTYTCKGPKPYRWRAAS